MTNVECILPKTKKALYKPKQSHLTALAVRKFYNAITDSKFVYYSR